MLKQGTIYMLKSRGIPKSHPHVLLGSYKDQYVLLIFTSFKKNEDGKYTTYYIEENKRKNVLKYNDLFSLSIDTYFSKDEEIEMDSSDGFRYWSQTNVKNFFLISKKNLEKIRKVGQLENKGWIKLITKYKELNQRYAPFQLFPLPEDEKEVRNWIKDLANFSYDMRLI